MDSKQYIGMDVHQASISIAIRDDSGRLVAESIISGATLPALDMLSARLKSSAGSVR